MGKHEIKLRRKSMTSRKIERHKNYAQLMNKHHKTQRTKRIIQWLILVFVFLLGLFVLYYSLIRKPKTTSTIHHHQTETNVNTTT
jgi:multisubunit Na+/H+ antiporter MnhB subunit